MNRGEMDADKSPPEPYAGGTVPVARLTPAPSLVYPPRLI